MKLTLLAKGPFLYHVSGLPQGQQAEVWKPGKNNNWKVRRTMDGRLGKWEGEYVTVDEALSHLESKLSQSEDTASTARLLENRSAAGEVHC